MAGTIRIWLSCAWRRGSCEAQNDGSGVSSDIPLSEGTGFISPVGFFTCYKVGIFSANTTKKCSFLVIIQMIRQSEPQPVSCKQI